MHTTPSELPHDTLLRSFATARSADEREMLLDEVRRRLERAPEPHQAPARPWDPANGGC